MKFTCPNCDHKYNTSKAHPGQKAKCKQCGRTFRVQLAPITITPSPQMPFDKVDKKKEESKKAGMFFVNLWKRTPVIFRNSFIATLGVISALWFAFSVVGIGRWMVPDESPKAVLKAQIDDRTEYLAATTLLLEKHTSYQTIQQTRMTAAGQAKSDAGLFKFLFTVQNLWPQLESLYFEVRKLQLPDHPDIAQAHQNLLSAIEAEYNFQKAAIRMCDDPENLKLSAEFDDALKKAVAAGNESLFSVCKLMIYIDENFMFAYSKMVE